MSFVKIGDDLVNIKFIEKLYEYDDSEYEETEHYLEIVFTSGKVATYSFADAKSRFVVIDRISNFIE